MRFNYHCIKNNLYSINPRFSLTKNNGNLGESGCVNWMFEKKGIVLINKSNLEEEKLLEDLLDLGIESYDELDDVYELLITPEEFPDIIKSLEDSGYNFEGNISLVPINFINIASNQVDSILKLINALEEHDDVQKVHTNISISE